MEFAAYVLMPDQETIQDEKQIKCFLKTEDQFLVDRIKVFLDQKWIVALRAFVLVTFGNGLDIYFFVAMLRLRRRRSSRSSRSNNSIGRICFHSLFLFIPVGNFWYWTVRRSRWGWSCWCQAIRENASVAQVSFSEKAGVNRVDLENQLFVFSILERWYRNDYGIPKNWSCLSWELEHQ